MKSEIKKICKICKKNCVVVVSKENDYIINHCKNCKTIYVDNPPEQSFLKDYYISNYPKLEENEWEKLMIPLFERDIRKISKIASKELNLKHNKFNNIKLLEIGCNYGSFLKMIEKAGIYVEGVEPAPKAFESVKRKNITVYSDFFENVKLEPNYYDIVTGWFILEHVINPDEFLSKIFFILKPGGMIFLRIPNIYPLYIIHKLDPILKTKYGNFLIKSLRSNKISKDKLLYMLDPPTHLWGFSRSSLKILLNNAGFTNINIYNDKMPKRGTYISYIDDSIKLISDLIKILSFNKILVSPIISINAQRPKI